MQEDRNALLHQISTNTINYRIKHWVDNFKANLPAIHAGHGIASLNATLTDVPCIIVGSGPTLDRNINQLRDLESRACIISCDSATKALLEHGIRPHLVLVTDSKPRVASFFEGVDTSALNFIVDSFVHPDTVAALQGRKYWYNTLPVEACPFTAALSQWTGFVGNLGTGGCVATSAWFLATNRELGLCCDPNVLVGLPEGFYDPASMYAQVVTKTVETEPYTTQPIETVDIFGKVCYTYPALQSFAFWFQNAFLMMPGIHINCSEGGILRENILNMPLQYCAERYLKAEYDIEAMLFVKEAAADAVIAAAQPDLTQYRQMLMVLLDGPSLPNLALRIGKTEPEMVELISTLRANGLAIHEGTTAIPAPDGTQVDVVTFLLQGVIDADAGSDMRQEGQQELTGQELVRVKG